MSTFKQKVLEVVKEIPLGQTRSYQVVAELAGRSRAYRTVGNILKRNYEPQIPCHRVICSDGRVGGYNRGSKLKRRLLQKEGAILAKRTTQIVIARACPRPDRGSESRLPRRTTRQSHKIKKTTFRKTKLHQLYLTLRLKYGQPRDFWQKWCQRNKSRQEREEIVIGAILTQRTNWRNVEMALANLRRTGNLSIKKIYHLAKNNRHLLESLIRPSGFYKQKAQRLTGLCKLIIGDHQTLPDFFQQDTALCRQQLLAISGIGPETADSILLYAGNKPVFVIDEYTRRWVKKYRLSQKFSYDYLQQLFQKNLPKSVRIYQDCHAMIVLEGKGTRWNLISKISR